MLTRRSEPAAASRPAGLPTAQRFHPHIQGLRTLAVASVVLYHLWPGRLTGGYVGVDVFFVISGFLICGHLVREIDATGSIRVLDFWARRVRRLLPASMTVLIAAAAFVLVALPAVDWDRNLGEIRAASLYVQNWQLVAASVDYLASGTAPSVVQHFWSLSVEEQFYFLQPLILLVGIALFRTRRVVLPILVAVVVLSLPYSMLLTQAQSGTAYFSTGTRAWEFAVGGIAAIVGSRISVRPSVQSVLGWAGLALVLIAVLVYTPSTPFPGWTAGLPVVGTAMALVFAGSTARLSPRALLSATPMTRLGDWSYSIYLWHWPLIVAAPVLLGRPAGWKVKVAILVLTIALAALTKRFVEDRFRRVGSGHRTWRTFAAMIAAMIVMVTGTTVVSSWQSARAAGQAAAAQAVFASAPERCLGAAALVNSCDRPYAVTAGIVPAAVAADVPWNVGMAASRGCHGQAMTDTAVARACVFADPPRPALTVALVGDSHADHIIDALGTYADAHNWRFITYTREGCSGIPSSRLGVESCSRWSADVLKELQRRSDIDAVVFSNYASHAEWTAADEAAVFRDLLERGRKVVPIVDVPGMPAGVSAPSCIEAHMSEYDPCTTAPPPTGKTELAARTVGIRAVSVNDVLCAGGRCHAVIGGESVYMDEAHLTFHFSSSLRDLLGGRVAAAVREQERTPVG